ncbi:uncharacterized protein LOC132197366 [Neocloeon triangulifer]|uniref:uncharacterized protein LOC132197366 n=1 Tax=Neocloeon triangulifer TaxID=2078957 RepID=UPI00286F8578|nr:uncharacterized protein LOC132197366 [Neocloeon triangulifer]
MSEMGTMEDKDWAHFSTKSSATQTDNMAEAQANYHHLVTLLKELEQEKREQTTLLRCYFNKFRVRYNEAVLNNFGSNYIPDLTVALSKARQMSSQFSMRIKNLKKQLEEARNQLCDTDHTDNDDSDSSSEESIEN